MHSEACTCPPRLRTHSATSSMSALAVSSPPPSSRRRFTIVCWSKRGPARGTERHAPRVRRRHSPMHAAGRHPRVSRLAGGDVRSMVPGGCAAERVQYHNISLQYVGKCSDSHTSSPGGLKRLLSLLLCDHLLGREAVPISLEVLDVTARDEEFAAHCVAAHASLAGDTFPFQRVRQHVQS